MEKHIEMLMAGKTDALRSAVWLPLWMHLRDTAEVMERLIRSWLPESVKKSIGFEEEKLIALARFLGGIHDIGKATVSFQSRILQCLPDARLRLEKHVSLNCAEQNFKHSPHARASEAILLELGCPGGIASIAGAHHGKPQESCKVGVQLDTWYDNYYSSGQKDLWMECWKEIFENVLGECGYKNASELPDSLKQPEEILLTGLLTMADWIASNTDYFPLIPLDEYGSEGLYPKRVDNAFYKLKLTDPWEAQSDIVDEEEFNGKFNFYPNSMQRATINAANTMSTPGLMILEAQMGAGKTEAALAASEILAAHFGESGIFFGLPTQATANGIFPRLKNWAKSQSDEVSHSIRLAHGMSELNEEYIKLPTQEVLVDDDAEDPESKIIVHQWFRGNKQALLADFVIGTVDQLLMSALKQKHVMLRHLGLAGKVVIIDECHAYDTYMNQYLDCALAWLGWYKVPVILLSATLPSKRRTELIEAYRGNIDDQPEQPWKGNQGYPLLTWTDGEDVKQEILPIDAEEKIVHIQNITEEKISDLLNEKLKNGGCAGIIVNTVRKAQKLAEALKSEMPEKEILVVHAQFLMPERATKEDMLMRRIGRDSTSDTRDGFIVIGTQVLEQSLDIDFDFMITELCPMDLLLQRIGRLHRHTRKRPKPVREAVCAILDTGDDSFDKGSSSVYGEWLLWRTRKLMPQILNLPTDISKLVQAVYGWETEELLCIDSNSQEKKNVYDKERKKQKQRAEAYVIGKPEIHTLLPQLNTLDDWMQEEMAGSSDISARAAVRDVDQSIEVLVMMRRNDGSIHFVSEAENAAGIPADCPPPPEVALQIARQKLRLPSIFSKVWKIEKVIKELETENIKYLSQWQLSPMLRGELILLLDEKLSIRLADMVLCYDSNNGLTYRKEETDEGDGI